MSELDAVYTALEDAVDPQRDIDLVAAADRAHLGGLKPLLAQLRISSTYPVTGAQVRRTAAVVLGGFASYGVPGGTTVPVSVTLTCTAVDANTVSFALALTVTGAWTFDSTFALPGSFSLDPDDPAVLDWGDSFLKGLPVGSPTFTATTGSRHVRLTGAVGPDGALAKYENWLAGWPLALAGDVDIPAAATDPPVLDLRAVVPGADLKVGPLELRSPGFRFRSVTGLDAAVNDTSAYSELDAAGTVQIGTTSPVRAEVSGPLAVSTDAWRLDVEFAPGDISIARGLTQLAEFLDVETGSLQPPPGLSEFANWYLQGVETWVVLDQSGLPSGVEAIGVTILRPNRTTPWTPGIPFVSVQDVGTTWKVTWVPGPQEPIKSITGNVFGSIAINTSKGPALIDLSATIPSFVIQGELREGTSIPIGEAFSHFFGQPGPATAKDMALTEMKVVAVPLEQIFSAQAKIEMDWPLPFFSAVALTGLQFEIGVSQSSVSGALAGYMRLGNGANPAMLGVRAEYPGGGAKGWTFSGGLEPGPPLRLVDLVKDLLQIDGDTTLQLNVDKLEGAVSVGDSTWELDGTWRFAGAISTRWQPELLGTTLDLRAGVGVALVKAEKNGTPTGTLSAFIAINRLKIELKRDVGIADPAYGIRVEFGRLWAQASVAWVDTKDQQKRRQVLTIQLGGISLGEVLEELVNLAAPTLGFSLDPPWDVLKKIDLSSFVLTIDPKYKSVELKYLVEKDFVLMYVKSVGVKYTLGAENAVELTVDGKLLGLQLDKPLAWDVVNDPPPALPGKGPKLIELRYMGLGQHVRLDRDVNTVREAVDLLAKDMKPPPSDPKTNPLSTSIVKFDGGSQWLVGLDVTVMDTVDLAVIFNDPVLYGLSIGLRGDRAGSLSGLKFEILYKRITDEIGMFRIELELPEAFRHIELGEVSITLGVIIVEIYTNGNFLIDLGFPHGRDYSRAFTVQVFPFIGRGGFYFGLLDGKTSRRVPQIVGGTFSPVLELGIGMAVGVGKEVSVGPLSGGAYLQIEVIFEGVLAWYHPATAGLPSGTYYRGQGIAAIHGKVYGQVDFKVVRASATIEASAEVSVIFEAYRATEFALRANVRVEAEIEILFISVSFHFEATLELSTTVGSNSTPPWTLAPAPGGPALAAPARRPQRLAMVQAAAASGGFDWKYDELVFSSKVDVGLTMLPLFSIDQPPLTWGTGGDDGDSPAYKVAVMLFADNGVAPTARTAAQAAVRATNGGELAAAVLVEALLRWCYSALESGSAAGYLTAGELDLIAAELDRPGVADEVFTLDHLNTFLATNLNVTITGDTGATQRGGMVVPMPPYVTLKATPGSSTDLSLLNKIGPEYERGAARYMNSFAPVAASSASDAHDDPSTYDSFAGVMFRDWCLMVAKAALRESRAALDGVTVAAGTGTLDALAAGSLPRDSVEYRVRPGDTVASVAAYLGEGLAELETLNPWLAGALETTPPGTTLSQKIVVGLTGASLALANADVDLKSGAQITLDGVQTQVLADESTLDAVAKRVYGADGHAAQLVTSAGLATHRSLLRADAAFTVPQLTSPVPGATTVGAVAAVMYVRLFADTHVPDADWYAQTIAVWNEDELDGFEPGVLIPPGTPLQVPAAPRSTTKQPYTTIAGDTLLRIGAALSLTQVPAAYTEPAWTAFRAAVHDNGSGGIVVPATPVKIQVGETLQDLAWRLVVPAGSVSTLLPWVQAADLLQALAVVEPDTLLVSGTNLRAIAQANGLTLAALAAQDGVVNATSPLFDATEELAVPHLPAQTIEKLVAAATGATGLAAISGQVSRQMLAGLRLPKPDYDTTGHATATGAPTALAELTGQQLAAPDPAGPTAPGLHLDVVKTSGAPGWFTLSGGTTLGFTYTNADLIADYPAKALTINTVGKTPTAMPLRGNVPRTYGLDHHVELQEATTVAIPGTPAQRPLGNSSLWPFSTALRARALEAGTVPFEVLTAQPGAHGEEHKALDNTTFATLVPLQIRRVPGYAHIYEVEGATGADRQLLLDLLDYIRTGAQGSATLLYLAIAPPPDAGNAAGLAVLNADTTSTFVVRVNLATDVEPQNPATVLHATLGTPGDFVQLLWEASVASGGFHLRFTTTDGEDLPAGALGGEGVGTLQLLAVPGAQQQAASSRPFLAINNCALVGPGLDASAHALYVTGHGIKYETQPAEFVPTALVPPGSVGFVLRTTRAMPPSDTTNGDTPQDARIKTLYSMLRYELTGSFASGPAPPVSPSADPGSSLEGWQRARMVRAALARGEETENGTAAPGWKFEQVVPAASFGPASKATSLPALPATSDPYRGYGGAAVQEVAFDLSFGDVLGNVTAAGGTKPVTAQLGYTDPLLGIGAWPGATATYGLTRSGTTVTLAVSIAAQPGSALPGPDELPDPPTLRDADRRAGNQAEMYGQVWFQLGQPTLSAKLLTTLSQDANGAPVVYDVAEGAAPLRRFAGAGYLFARGAMSATAADLSGLATLSDVITTYGMTAGAVARANAQVAAGAMFTPGQTITATAYVPFAEQQTADDIVAAVKSGPKPADGTALLQITENTQLPLRPGTVIILPQARSIPLGATPLALQDVAQQNGTTTAQLAIDLAGQAVLATGFEFTHGGHVVTVGPGASTLAEVQSVFESVAAGISLSELGELVAADPKLFEANATLLQTHVVTGEHDTFATLSTYAPVAQLAGCNHKVPNLFVAGAPIALGAWSPAPTIPADGTTLDELAHSVSMSAEQLIAANGALTMASPTQLVLPGTVSLPDGTAVPYLVMTGDTLPILATQFGTTAEAIVAASAPLAGTLTAGVNVSVTADGKTSSTQTQAGDSFQAVYDRLHADNAAVTLALVAGSLAGLGAILVTGALLACPPAALEPKAGTAPAAFTGADVQTNYGVAPTAFAAANAAVAGVLAPNVTIAVKNTDGTVRASVVTAAKDTLNAVMRRLSLLGASASIDQLMTDNASVALFRTGTRALLPAPPATVTAQIGAITGPFAAPAFPLVVTLRLQRADAAVQDEFKTTTKDGPVERADAVVPAPARAPDGSAARTFDEFVDACLTAIPNMRLATGTVEGVAGDLWAVAFGTEESGGKVQQIESVTVKPTVVYPDGTTDARFFALQPLYRDLLSLSTGVQPITSTGGLGPAVTHEFQGVDTEPWARRFLTDIDTYLTAPYAAAILENTAAAAALDRLLAAKWKLAGGISAGLAPVLQVTTDTHAAAGLTTATARVKQMCAESLSRTYAVSAVVQYDTTAKSPYGTGDLLPARLSGSAQQEQAGTTFEDFGLTTARTALDQATSFATFALTSRDPSHHGTVAADLDYVFDQLEFNVAAVTTVDGYERADWLSFVRPLTGAYLPTGVSTNVGPTKVPIPLRTHPGLPVLQAQTATPTFTGPGKPTLADASKWTLGVTYAHEHAAQDEVRLSVTFNLHRLFGDAASTPDLANALAAYATVADDLGALMAWYVDPPKGVDAATLQAVRDTTAGSLATLTEAVADAWSGHWTGGLAPHLRASDPPAGTTYAYRLRATYGDDPAGNAELTGAVVTLDQTAAGPDGQWPQLWLVQEDGTEVEFKQKQVVGKRATYAPDSAVPAPSWPTFRLAWASLNVAVWQNARAAISVRRNPELRDGIPTSDRFLLTTARVEAPDVVTPLVEWSNEFALSGADSTAALQSAFDALFGTGANGMSITVGVGYGYALVEPDQGIDGSGLTSVLPVGLYPDQRVTSQTAGDIAGPIETWRTSAKPSSTGGEWRFSLTLHSTLSSGPPRPLMTIQQMVFPLG